MSKQRTLAAFFKPSRPKRTCTEESDSPQKVRKIENPHTDTSAAASASHTGTPEKRVSDDQKIRIEDNKLQAKLKLVIKKSGGVIPPSFGISWFSVLEEEFSKPYFAKVCEFLEGERKTQTIFPPPEDVFSFTHMCDFDKVKVVILGQDPYHDQNQAHGLCFSVRKGVKVPPSLMNIYKELKSDIPGFVPPSHGYLEGWARQGVLLLNAVLTVKAHNANSHKGKGWEQLTDAIISQVNNRLSGVVFLLWGKDAQKKGARIDKKKHLVLMSVHPSPLSASRGFLGCKHFSKCNTFLKDHGQDPIDWSKLP